MFVAFLSQLSNIRPRLSLKHLHPRCLDIFSQSGKEQHPSSVANVHSVSNVLFLLCRNGCLGSSESCRIEKENQKSVPEKIGFFWFLKKKKNVMLGIMKKSKDGREIFQ